MIQYVTGDIFNSNVQALVNPVNTVGVMGKGLALQFKKKYPDNFKEYAKACKNGELTIGKMFVYTENQLNNKKIIINFPTKISWREKNKLEYIIEGLKNLYVTVKRLNIYSIAIPPLGCGLGGLLWEDVKKEIEKVFINDSEIIAFVYIPSKI